MHPIALAPRQIVPVAVALLRGSAEFLSLQRCRLKAWLAR